MCSLAELLPVECFALVFLLFGFWFLKSKSLSSLFARKQNASLQQLLKPQCDPQYLPKFDLNDCGEGNQVQLGKLLDNYIQAERLEIAEWLIIRQKQVPTTYVLTILMKGYSKMKQFDKATALLQFMRESATAKPNIVTNNTYLQCCLESERYAEADLFFGSMPAKDVVTHSTYIKGLFKQERTDDVVLHFESFLS